MLPQRLNSIGSLEEYFSPFARNIIGQRQFFASPFGRNRIVYADWTAGGRGYLPIEQRLQNEVLPYFANTHTGTTVTGRSMTQAYEQAKAIVREHVHATEDDVLLFCGSGMTDAVCRLQRILGLRMPGWVKNPVHEENRPLVLVTHMEHHSNHITWMETVATVEMIRPSSDGKVDLEHLCQLLHQYRHRKIRIAAITACSNVTGIQTPVHAIATLMHKQGGYCFVDFAAAAPYTSIDMHPSDPATGDLDAIYFSGHKFLGGPGTPGVLLFNRRMYNNRVPDRPGGGTLLYTNPWGGREYVSDIEQREDGGTPPILQAIKLALCIRLKEEMGVPQLLEREGEMLNKVFGRLPRLPGVEILEDGQRHRLGIISFMVRNKQYNLLVRLLNDRFGIQTRGGCSCAGPYGHLLLNIGEERSRAILASLRAGDLSCKPGWVRLSLHPTMTDDEIDYILDAIGIAILEYPQWEKDYVLDPACNEFVFRGWQEPVLQCFGRLPQ